MAPVPRVQQLLPPLQQWGCDGGWGCLQNSWFDIWGKAGPFQALVTLKSPFSWTLSSPDDLRKVSFPGDCCLSQLLSVSSVWNDAFVFCGDKNVFGSEDLVCLSKIDFFPLLCPQETCSSPWNVMDPQIIIFLLGLRDVAQSCAVSLRIIVS